MLSKNCTSHSHTIQYLYSDGVEMKTECPNRCQLRYHKVICKVQRSYHVLYIQAPIISVYD